MTEQHSPTRRFWLGGRRAAEQDRFFREALEPLGWEVGDEHDWDAGWITGMPASAQFRRVSPGRRLNHFPGNAALTVKSRLHESLSTLRERMVESHGAASEPASRLAFFPRSWVMPDDYHALQDTALANPDQRWILKPTNASKGKGVRVLRDAGDAPLAADWMVQEYLANPHTIRGHKYVLRLYVLISSLEPLRVYLYRQGFAKLASEPWDPEDADNPFSQLTNPDINALNDRADVPVEFIDLDRYRAWLRDQGHDDDRLFARIHDLVALTAISAVDAMRGRTAEVGADPRGCYELLGLDCLVDDTLKPWILECNLSPSLGICAAPENGGRVEEAVKGGLVRDMVALLDIPGTVATEGEEEVTAARLVAEAEAEQARAGDFLRLLPAEEPARYLPFFTLPTLADLQLAEGLSGRPMTRPLLRRRQVAELLEDDQLALYDTRSGRYFRPNDTAAMIWLLATEGLDPDAIAEELAQAAAQAGTSPDVAALRRDVWATLGEWCREGLLCQRGESPVARPVEAAMPETEPAAKPAERSRLQLSHDGRNWALEVGSSAALARLSMLLGERLAPLDNAAESEPLRLAVLVEPAGYALVAGSEVVRSRLTLTQLVPALLAYLVGQAARPGQPVVDAHLLVTREGSGVLCLLSDESGCRDRLQRLTALGATLTRGVRLNLADLDAAEPLGLPLTIPAGEARQAPPSGVSIRAVLVSTDTEDLLATAGVLDVLGAMLPCCISAPGESLTPDQVVALGEWVARLECLGVGDADHLPVTDPLADWLVGRVASDAVAEDPAMAKG